MTGETVPETLDRLGPYRLLRRLGEGGMGVVHLGLDEEGREVAVKVLHPHVASDLKARDRLTREVETMRRVRSVRVAAVLDAELTGSTPYIVTRFSPGRTLEETVLSDGPLSAREVVRLARGLSEALIAIHAADVIHRDFKPANVMIVDGDPLVIDFGIAHLVNATRLTQTGMFVGTPGYLAPEIIRDDEITQAADVHALAATVFFGATGKPPFGTGSFESVCYNIMEGRANLDQAPAWLRGWLSAAFAVNVAARPDAHRLLAMAKSLDPTMTSFQESPAKSGHTRMLGSPPAEQVLDGTRVLNGSVPDATHVLNGSAPDGTHVLNGPVPGGTGAQDDLPPTKRTKPASEESYSDLLPPVRYAEPERKRNRVEAAPPQQRDPVPPAPAPGAAPAGFAPPPRAPSHASPPAYPPAPHGPPGRYPPAPYGPPGQYPPAPYPDQRVAGYPPPPPGGPPAPYAPPQPPDQRRDQRRGPNEHDQNRPRYRTGHPVLAALLLVVAAGGARLLPVLVSVLMVVVALCLRVGEYLWSDLAQRRSIRGNSASDPLLAVLGTPWALIKASLMTLVATPLAGMLALCAWGALYYFGGYSVSDATADSAAAYAAAAFVAGLFLLPGGGAPRKAVARTLTSVIRSPGAGMVLAIIIGTVAFFVVVTAMRTDPSWVPWREPSVAIGELGRSARNSAIGLVGGLIKDLIGQQGFGFLSFGR